MESIEDSEICYFDRASKYEVIFHNEAIAKMLSIEEVQMNLHTPCLLLNKKQRKSIHDLTKTSQEKLQKQHYMVFRREDHNFFEAQNGTDIRNSIYQEGSSSKAVYVNARRHKIRYHGKKCLLLSLRDVSASMRLD